MEGKTYRYLTPKTACKNGISTVYQDLSLDNYRDAVGNIFLGREMQMMSQLEPMPETGKGEKRIRWGQSPADPHSFTKVMAL